MDIVKKEAEFLNYQGCKYLQKYMNKKKDFY